MLEGLLKTQFEICDFALATQKVWQVGWMYIMYVSVCFGGRNSQLRSIASQSQNMRDIFKLEHKCVLSHAFTTNTFTTNMSRKDSLVKRVPCQAGSNIYIKHHPHLEQVGHSHRGGLVVEGFIFRLHCKYARSHI